MIAYTLDFVDGNCSYGRKGVETNEAGKEE